MYEAFLARPNFSTKDLIKVNVEDPKLCPRYSCRIIKNIKVWAQRLSYVGELGYELYVEFKDAKKIYELIINRGKNFNLSN